MSTLVLVHRSDECPTPLHPGHVSISRTAGVKKGSVLTPIIDMQSEKVYIQELNRVMSGQLQCNFNGLRTCSMLHTVWKVVFPHPLPHTGLGLGDYSVARAKLEIFLVSLNASKTPRTYSCHRKTKAWHRFWHLIQETYTLTVLSFLKDDFRQIKLAQAF